MPSRVPYTGKALDDERFATAGGSVHKNALFALHVAMELDYRAARQVPARRQLHNKRCLQREALLHANLIQRRVAGRSLKCDESVSHCTPANLQCMRERTV